MLDSFDEYFADITQGASLLQAIRLVYSKGYFKFQGRGLTPPSLEGIHF